MASTVRPPTRLNRKGLNRPNPPNPPNPANVPPGLKLILIGLPIVIFSSYGMYKRLYLKQEKKEQLGELDGEGQLRLFTEEEVKRRSQESWFSKLFGNK